MRKHLVALLSMLGLAGSAMPAQSQTVQDSHAPEQKVAGERLKKAQTKKRGAAETQFKDSKAAAERQAMESEAQLKAAKRGAAGKSDAQLKIDSHAAERRKARGEAVIKIDKTGKVAPQAAPKQ